MRVFAFLLLTALAACSSAPTRDEVDAVRRSQRAGSLARIVSLTVSGAPLASFVLARTAALVHGADPTPARAADLRIGAAAALTSDGYFLTAAHCVREGPAWVAPPGEAWRPARVVWVGTGQADLALVHAPGPTVPFAWATDEDLANAALVVGAGLGAPQRALLRDAVELEPGATVFAGHVFGISPPTKDDARVVALAISAPFASGDSGGPLVDAGGRLLGANVWSNAFRTERGLGIWATALRPDPKWIRDLISIDRRR